MLTPCFLSLFEINLQPLFSGFSHKYVIQHIICPYNNLSLVYPCFIKNNYIEFQENFLVFSYYLKEYILCVGSSGLKFLFEIYLCYGLTVSIVYTWYNHKENILWVQIKHFIYFQLFKPRVMPIFQFSLMYLKVDTILEEQKVFSEEQIKHETLSSKFC